jgi:hypothetical protein
MYPLLASHEHKVRPSPSVSDSTRAIPKSSRWDALGEALEHSLKVVIKLFGNSICRRNLMRLCANVQRVSDIIASACSNPYHQRRRSSLLSGSASARMPRNYISPTCSSVNLSSSERCSTDFGDDIDTEWASEHKFFLQRVSVFLRLLLVLASTVTAPLDSIFIFFQIY